jgi:hypothetical protein
MSMTPVPDTLWHGTGVLRAALILSEDHLRQWAWDQFGAGVSFATERSSAEYFAIRADTEDAARQAFRKVHGPDADYEYDSGKAEEAFPLLRGVVIEVDAARLLADHRSRKIAYTGDWDDEVELRVGGEAGIPGILGYVRSVSYRPENVDWWEASNAAHGEALARLREVCESLGLSLDDEPEASSAPAM